jgi:hypothetical protein
VLIRKTVEDGLPKIAQRLVSGRLRRVSPIPLCLQIELTIFSRIHEFENGPRTTINVKGGTYSLPKLLLCYCSTYFNAVFNGPFKEGSSQKVDLEDIDKAHFDLVVQWIYGGSVNLDRQPGLTSTDKLSHYIAFIKLVDRLDIHGDFSNVCVLIQKILLGPAFVTPQHIRDVVELPKGHALREMFARNCALWYVGDLGFNFAKELEELEGFASGFSQYSDL